MLHEQLDCDLVAQASLNLDEMLLRLSSSVEVRDPLLVDRDDDAEVVLHDGMHDRTQQQL